MILGAHASTAGGLALAPERARADGCDALQIFTRSSRQWAATPIAPAEAAAFKAACRAHGMQGVLAHGSYLINLASPDPALWERSIAAFADELRRCAALGVRLLVTHPGTPQAAGPAFGIDRVAAALDRALALADVRGVRVLLENTAGSGSHLGARFAELAAIRRATDHRGRIGFCFDTQHAFAAGHDLRTAASYAATFEMFEREAGLAHLAAFHLNDSLRELGGRVDRHACIGTGLLGDRAFARLVNDPRFAALPGVLETPPLPSGEPSFASGVARLRGLDRPRGSPAARRDRPRGSPAARLRR